MHRKPEGLDLLKLPNITNINQLSARNDNIDSHMVSNASNASHSIVLKHSSRRNRNVTEDQQESSTQTKQSENPSLVNQSPFKDYKSSTASLMNIYQSQMSRQNNYNRSSPIARKTYENTKSVVMNTNFSLRGKKSDELNKQLQNFIQTKNETNRKLYNVLYGSNKIGAQQYLKKEFIVNEEISSLLEEDTL